MCSQWQLIATILSVPLGILIGIGIIIVKNIKSTHESALALDEGGEQRLQEGNQELWLQYRWNVISGVVGGVASMSAIYFASLLYIHINTIFELYLKIPINACKDLRQVYQEGWVG